MRSPTWLARSSSPPASLARGFAGIRLDLAGQRAQAMPHFEACDALAREDPALRSRYPALEVYEWAAARLAFARRSR